MLIRPAYDVPYGMILQDIRGGQLIDGDIRNNVMTVLVY